MHCNAYGYLLTRFVSFRQTFVHSFSFISTLVQNPESIWIAQEITMCCVYNAYECALVHSQTKREMKKRKRQMHKRMCMGYKCNSNICFSSGNFQQRKGYIIEFEFNSNRETMLNLHKDERPSILWCCSVNLCSDNRFLSHEYAHTLSLLFFLIVSFFTPSFIPSSPQIHFVQIADLQIY